MKIVICDPQQKPDELLPALNARLRRYPDHVAGDRYYVINVNGNPTGGSARLYGWEAPGDGFFPDERFTEVPPGSDFPYRLTTLNGDRFDDPGIGLSG